MPLEKIDRLTDRQVKELQAMYQLEWWTRGRQLADVRRMLRHSDEIVAFCEAETGHLVAFARVLTDYVYKALIFDVIVAESYRGEGLGRRVMEAIIEQPALASVQHFELYCLPEMMPFYQKWGFTADLGELHFMRRNEETSYDRPGGHAAGGSGLVGHSPE